MHGINAQAYLRRPRHEGMDYHFQILVVEGKRPQSEAPRNRDVKSLDIGNIAFAGAQYEYIVQLTGLDAVVEFQDRMPDLIRLIAADSALAGRWSEFQPRIVPCYAHIGFERELL